MGEVPPPAAAVLRALRLRDPDLSPIRDWQGALDFADRSGLSLFLPTLPFPEPARIRLDACLARNCERLRRLRILYRQIPAILDEAGIPFVFLKGLTQCRLSGIPPGRRVQYDIDLFTPPERAAQASAALSRLGFEPFREAEGRSSEHLPPLIRRTGWEFRGDYFDPEIPASVEIHFRLWDGAALFLGAPGPAGFFERRNRNMLAPADALGHAALHLLKHLLLGSVRPFHVYELARILHRQRANRALWSEWRRLHAPESRQLQTLSFRLAHEWFGCELPEAAEQDWSSLAPRTRAWFGEFAFSPLEPANKNELWLHSSLVPGVLDRARIVRRRLLPLRPPGPVDGVYLDKTRFDWRRRLLRFWRQSRFAAGRARHHVTAALRLAADGARWWWKSPRACGSEIAAAAPRTARAKSFAASMHRRVRPPQSLRHGRG
jgi:hypothetical protein